MKCLNLSQENGIQSGVLYSTLNLGDFHRTMGNYSKAYDYLSRSLDIASSQGMIREEALLLERLSWLSRDKKDFEAAYEYQLQSTAISDSLRSEQVQRDVAELTLQYETEKKEKELSLLKVKSQRQLLIIGVGVVCLLILVIGVLTHLILKAEPDAME